MTFGAFVDSALAWYPYSGDRQPIAREHYAVARPGAVRSTGHAARHAACMPGDTRHTGLARRRGVPSGWSGPWSCPSHSGTVAAQALFLTLSASIPRCSTEGMVHEVG